MNPLITFFLGLLSGWLMKWLIDFSQRPERLAQRSEPDSSRTRAGSRATSTGEGQSLAVRRTAPDDLKVIKGIGPVIERKLNEAGIYTFGQLGSLTAHDLQRILGKTIQRLADEEALLQQARDLAVGK